MKHPCAVAGQSNSILHYGFVRKLVERGSIDLVASARLGASPSVTAHMFFEPGFFRDARFCIFDVCVMDTTYWWSDAVRMIDLANWVEAAVHACQRSRVIPLMVMIPHRAAMGRSPLTDLYRDICIDGGGACLDVSNLLQSRSEALERPIDDFFADPSHLNEESSVWVAEALADYMDGCTFTEESVIQAAHAYDVVRLGGVSRRNSLIGWEFQTLAESDVLEVPTGSVGRVSAVIFNGALSSGRLRVRGQGEVVKELGTIHRRPDADFTIVAAPLMGEVKDVAGRISLSLTRDAATEPTFQSAPSEAHVLEIGGLVVEREPRVRLVTRSRVDNPRVPIPGGPSAAQ